jgi:hypothetical protein
MLAICTNKKTGNTFRVSASNVSGWLIGGDVPEYKTTHYIIISKGIEYTLKNGRLIKA